ncbi:MAG TPA: septum site-determining protein MinC [Methylomusa anaerophila]|uniref:Probable septum site-determining protein MinC n=1 Tax=Methylomusa anaerophila TaxID=1930071 RepID=A0A348AFA3_9FIRM|nr:septum site-determining protein MinC [Methylomusa anaerophila]BBB89751.1 septum site-determining protein MinC [Methylomusa anaerophila]HML89203.1 septum site-determining protein MinC [Methylomusa anaerophila]
MREDVVFKGSKGGLQLILNASADFSHILDQLKTKLESAAHFFTSGATVNLTPECGDLTPEERWQVINLLADYGLSPGEIIESVKAETKLATEVPLEYQQEADGSKTLIVTRMLRSGQKIVYDGNVIIMGDVNPGAQVVAGGDITVHGTCRGLAHAGSCGNEKARVTATKLMAAQLRIAGIIARAPDNSDEPDYPETARIARGIVVIEPSDKKV